MKKIDISDYTRLGYNLCFLREVFNKNHLVKFRGTSITGGNGLVDVFELEIAFLKANDISPFVISEMSKFKKLIDDNYPNIEGRLSEKDSALLASRVSIWEETIFNEVQNKICFTTQPSLILNSDNLINGASTFFKPETWKKLNQISIRDLNEAATCIIYSLPTPAGILALRATESELRSFYTKTTNKSIPEKFNWGNIITELKNTNIDQTLVGLLDFLRKNLRNKLSHPDSILEQKEAENIFSMIVTTIETMHS